MHRVGACVSRERAEQEYTIEIFKYNNYTRVANCFNDVVMIVARQFPAFPESEYRLRLVRLQGRMAAGGLHGIVLLNRANVAWISGFRPSIIAPNMAFVAAFVPVEGDAQLIAMPGLANLMRETSWGEVSTVGSAADGIAALLARAGTTGQIGVEHSLGLHRAADAVEIAAIEDGIGARRLFDASRLLWDCRIIKTLWEQELYRRLGEITSVGFHAGLATIGAGISEHEIARAMWSAMLAAGADAGPNGGQLMVRSGRARYPVFCGPPTPRRIEVGDQVMLAGGPVLAGYHIDIHRFANVGPVSDLQARLYEQSRRGIDAALAAVKPGVTLGRLFAVAADAMRDVGASGALAWRVFGHGIGLENYEFPMIEAGSSIELEEGMALAIEIPAYDIPEFRVQGAFLEECILVTASGAELLTAGVSRDLHVVS